ncbi:sigma-54 dependent transcriptional regulator PrdR [Tissierella sp.]|uniref:sigma-54 dependent transcriptional regulator PrdR n=1 Tax=Tissierella sp. TaxID=41274 RepID=UPI0028A6078C|nr:sigma-54 dependent transcriptional regulator PrdR [Tissierella sp.]
MTEHYIADFQSIVDIMNEEIIFIEESTSIEITLREMLINSKYEVVIVKSYNDKNNYNNTLGIITISDIGRLAREKVNLDDKIGNWINSNIVTISIEENIRTAKILMKESCTERLLILRDENIVGMLTPLELFRHQDLRKDEIELQLRLILGNLHEAVCVINTSGIVTFWNASSEKLYGIKTKEIVGSHIEKFFPNALLLRALKERRTFENLKHTPKDESDVIISAIPLIYKGELIGAVSTDRDLNEITNLYMELDREKTKVEILKQQMKEITQDKYFFGKIIGKSKALIDAMTIAKQVAKTDASVLITGESGTGKEVFSRAIHQESDRKGDFIPVNCSAIPSNLLESELFGYVEGAFTGAYKKGRAGKFELANGGTLFLDEIGDMPLLMQAKLLRVLQDGIVYRVGSGKPIKVDARIIAATNKDLYQLMEEGKFREDLYYRLNVVSIRIPPLRERKEDIPELINDFITEFSEKNNKNNIHISPEAMKILSDYHWKGNIRELKNTIERLVILSKDDIIESKDIPAEIISSMNISPFIALDIDNSFDLKKAVENFEKNIIIDALAAVKGNKVQAAELLNIKRSTLYYKLDLYNLN